MILPWFEIVQKFSRVHHICVSCHSGANNNLHVNVLVLSKQQMEKRSQTPASCWLMTYTLNSFIGTRWLQFLFDSNVGVVICSNAISSKWSRHHGPKVPFKEKIDKQLYKIILERKTNTTNLNEHHSMSELSLWMRKQYQGD